jgi:hypothetical protein
MSLTWKQAWINLKTTKNEACGALRADQRFGKTSQKRAGSGKTGGRTFGVQSLRQVGRMRLNASFWPGPEVLLSRLPGRKRLDYTF